MVAIVNTYKQSMPSTRFIGMKYGDEDRVNGSFGAKWHEWIETGRFEKLPPITEDFRQAYEDYDASIGLMRWKAGEKFEYWIGMFLPEGTTVPEGFESIDFPASNLGVCWLQGKESELFGIEDTCAQKLRADGFEVVTDEEGALWFFERYGNPRFTQPDENGNSILDICHFVK
ncbi:AraC family transcriptional regulator [Lederbergia graminis]|uniref:AraC family transcriptional regulator n=1 Tax=Lederbergia graminis TaxID=735518 RepID=A0ABW0LMZ1_9BACI